MNEKEKEILYTLLEDPPQFEKVTIKPNLFKGLGKRIFDEFQRQFNESQAFSYAEAADNLGMTKEELEGHFKGFYQFDASRLDFKLKKLERGSLSKKMIAALKKEMDTELKTGTISNSAMAEIRETFNKLDALNETGPTSMDYNSVKSKNIDWLWTGRIPLGMVTLIAGHPGIGKSFFTAWLAAKMSKGIALPGHESKTKIKPCSTLLISAEDDEESTIKPRLEGNEADFSKIIRLSDPMNFSLDSIGTLERELDKNPSICLVVLDPLTAFLGHHTDYFRDPDVRLKLIPLKELAQKRMISILGVVHFNKKEDSDIITRIGGSIAFAGVARSILGVSYDHREIDKDNRDTRLLSSLKMNLARKPDTIAFKINDNLKIDFDPRPVMVDAEVIFSRESRERKQRQGFAETWLLNYLEENPESLSRDVLKAAEEEDISKATIYRAKAKLDSQKLTDTHETGFGKDNRSYWRLASNGKEE